MVKYVLFDLDGTLLPMDQDVFVEAYFKGLAKKLAPYGYDPKQLIGAIWQGTKAMICNSGEMTNEQVFWQVFTGIFGEGSRSAEPILEAFYQTDFQQVQQVCGFAPQANEIIGQVKKKGLIPVLATNPIFPRIATMSRIRWAGLNAEDFKLITTYENSRSCKPNPAYYQDVLDAIGAKPEECVMVGNDVQDDMITATLGIQTFLLTDCIINKSGSDISGYRQGSFDALAAFIAQL